MDTNPKPHEVDLRARIDSGVKTAAHLSAAPKPEGDPYLENIHAAARYVAGLGYPEATYHTQWASGTTLWTLDRGHCLIVTRPGEVIEEQR